MVLFSDDINMKCEGSFIDEAGCFISMLDETKTKANIYVIDWQYAVDQPPIRNKRMETIESLDAASDSGAKNLQSMVNPTTDKLTGKNQDGILSNSAHPRSKKLMTAKERRRILIEAAKKKAAKGATEENKQEKSRLCSIF